MTATAQQLITVARSQIGFEETGGPSGHDGNITPYWAELAPAFQGQPYCAAGVRWSQKHAGAPLLPLGSPYYCPSWLSYAKAHDLWDESGRYEPGDLPLFDWSGHGVPEHIEILEHDNGPTVTDVGFNTTPADGGDQANGGGCYERVRPHGPTLMGVVAYSRLLGSAPAPVPLHVPVHDPYPAPTRLLRMQSPMLGGSDVKFAQWAAGAAVDGEFGPQTDHAVRLFQRYHHCTVDGVVGPQTTAAMRLITH